MFFTSGVFFGGVSLHRLHNFMAINGKTFTDCKPHGINVAKRKLPCLAKKIQTFPLISCTVAIYLPEFPSKLIRRPRLRIAWPNDNMWKALSSALRALLLMKCSSPERYIMAPTTWRENEWRRYVCENQRGNKAKANQLHPGHSFQKRAALGGIRTHDTLQSRRAFYHLSYQGNSAGRVSHWNPSLTEMRMALSNDLFSSHEKFLPWTRLCIRFIGLYINKSYSNF